jgi:hypothetical protein
LFLLERVDVRRVGDGIGHLPLDGVGRLRLREHARTRAARDAQQQPTQHTPSFSG